MPLIAALMPGHALALIPNLYVGRVDLHLDRGTYRQWRRVEVRQRPRAPAGVDIGKMQRSQIKTLRGQRKKMLPFRDHRRANALRVARNDAALLLPRPSRQQQVQLFQVPHLRNRHQIVATELAPFALDAAFLVTLARRTELRRKSPVRAKSDKPRGLFPLMAAQYLLHGTF